MGSEMCIRDSRNKEELLSAREIAVTYTPQMDEKTREKKRRNWKRAVQRSLLWAKEDEE